MITFSQKISASLAIAFLSSTLYVHSARGHSPDYTEAIPKFLEKISNRVKDSPQKEPIFQWTQHTSAQLPDFFSDLIALTKAVQEQPLKEPDLAPFEEFVAKWEDIINSCEDCDDVVPLLEPTVRRMFRDLPRPRAARAGDAPLQNLYEFYQQMEARNPAGLGPFFHLEFLPENKRRLEIKEFSRERTVHGVKTVTVVNRSAKKITETGLVFFERVNNDQGQVFFAHQYPTLLEEVLAGVKRNNGDPKVIDALYRLIALVYDELRKAHDRQLLDDFSYAFLLDQEPIRIQLIHLYHPLLRYPYNERYKTAELYPQP